MSGQQRPGNTAGAGAGFVGARLGAPVGGLVGATAAGLGATAAGLGAGVAVSATEGYP